MKFYQENKINPLASCLPLLLQLPVFISLFYMLRTDLKKHICGTSSSAYNKAHRTTVTRPSHSLDLRNTSNNELQHGRPTTPPSSCSCRTSPTRPPASHWSF